LVDGRPIPFGGASKEALVRALHEARCLGHNYGGTEHILLGLLHAEGAAQRILLAERARVDVVRKQVDDWRAPTWAS